MTVGGLEYYYQTNSIGSIVALTDSTGVVVERYEYTAFGTPTFLKPDGTVKAVQKSDYGNEYLFQGRRYDSETGLYYYRARYYDSGKGRFLSRDPLMYKDSMNLYQAFGGNPVNLVDPMGTDSLDPTEKKLIKQFAKFIKAEGRSHSGADNIGKQLLFMLRVDTVIKGKCGGGTLAEVGPYFIMQSVSGWDFDTLDSWFTWKRRLKYSNTHMAFNRSFLERGDFGGGVLYGSPYVPTNETKMLLLLTAYHEGVHAYERIIGILQGGFTLEWRATTQSIAFARHLRRRLLRLFGFEAQVNRSMCGMQEILDNLSYARLRGQLAIANIPFGMDKSFCELFGGSSLLKQLTAIQRFIRSEQKYNFDTYGKLQAKKIVQKIMGTTDIGRQMGLAIKLMKLQKKYEVDLDIDWQRGTVKAKGRG